MLLTVKRGSGGERLEEEIEITESQYRALGPLSEESLARYGLPGGNE